MGTESTDPSSHAATWEITTRNTTNNKDLTFARVVSSFEGCWAGTLPPPPKATLQSLRLAYGCAPQAQHGSWHSESMAFVCVTWEGSSSQLHHLMTQPLLFPAESPYLEQCWHRARLPFQPGVLFSPLCGVPHPLYYVLCSYVSITPLCPATQQRSVKGGGRWEHMQESSLNAERREGGQ